MPKMMIDCPDWIPELKESAFDGATMLAQCERWFGDSRYKSFYTLFRVAHWNAPVRISTREGQWRYAMKEMGYIYDAGWCYVD